MSRHDFRFFFSSRFDQHFVNSFEAVPRHEALYEGRVQSTGQSSHDAASYLYSMSAFSFIVAAVILALTRPLSVGLQNKEYDLALAHEDAPNLVADIQSQQFQSSDSFIYIRYIYIALEDEEHQLRC